MKRLAWKEGLLAAIDQAAMQPPSPLGENPAFFQRVLVRGHYLPGTARYGVEVRSGMSGPVMGARVLSLFQPEGALSVIVDRGWAPDDAPLLPPNGDLVAGYIRPPDQRSWFSPSDDLKRGQFFTLDPSAIGHFLNAAAVRPFVVVATGAPSGPLQPALGPPVLPNNHLTYALTWFALSAVLLVGFGFYAAQTLREPAA